MSGSLWPEPTRENRPWTRWWWMGSALSEVEITRSLDAFHAAGIGGVEISPIYGVPGYEDRGVEYLSDRWVALLAYTLHEADRLGLGVDMIVGTGWPFGGPWVSDADAPRKLIWETVAAGNAPGADTLAISPPDADGHLLALRLAHTGQQVKRAAPGGAGNVLDHYSARAARRYFEHFDAPLAKLPATPGLRAFFNDSFEVFGANATPDLLTEFSRQRGYDLADHLRALHGEGDADTVRRVRSDYRETVGDLVRDDFLGIWSGWAKAHGALIRNQAHGSPGNLLDLYGAADIPETEIFGPIRLAKSGRKALRPVPPDFGAGEEPLLCRMASSAAHVMGRRLCSSESFTWMGEHGCVPLDHGKAEVDTLFTMGINHVFFHGTPFSPSDAPWPGWLFYASTHVAPTNPFWRDLPALNAYIERCQSLLQQGAPDGDVLLYFPFFDILASETGAKDDLQFLTFHNTDNWLRGSLPMFTQIAHALEDGGWAFDMVSDRQLIDQIEVAEGELAARNGGARYRALVIAGCHLMPPETLERIATLAQKGAKVLLLGKGPADVPGLTDLLARRSRLAAAHAQLTAAGVESGDDLDELRSRADTRPEPLTASGIEWTRRRNDDGTRTYFLANPGRTDWEGWTVLNYVTEAATLLDPMTGAVGAARTRPGKSSAEVWLSLPAGASLLLRTVGMATPFPPTPEHAVAELSGPWEVEFLEGGPTLPAPRRLAALTDWTTWHGDDVDAIRAFSGTARFTCRFDVPAHGPESGYALDLGEVCHSARVRVNGADAGTLFARPFRLPLAVPLLPTGNVLEIEVTNLMANRLADLERREGTTWRPFLFVNIRYQPFDAADWEPLPSGLIGPVRLLRTVTA
jgi:hypothetical protein